MISEIYDIAIVGAGIVGAACADECARQGLRVALIEADVIGGGATAEGMGHIVVMDDSEAQFALTHYSQTLWRELAEELPADSEYAASGTIWVAADDEELAEVKRKQVFYEERGVKVEVLDPARLYEAEPHLRPDLVGGLLVPSDGVTYPPGAARFLVERALSHGATLYLGRAAVKFLDRGVLLNDGSFINAGLTVNAAGCWSPALTEGIHVQKRKGHLVITDRAPGFVRHQLVELGYLKSAHSLTSDSVAFNVQPRITGQVLIGSSRQYGVEERRVDPPILRRMIERAVEYMPGLAQLSAIRTWTGFRAATPDKLPLIGPLPDRGNLYLATGHEGLGITTSLGTARLLADQILGRSPAIPIEPYLPTRVYKEAAHA
ncbi:MAG TPA: FAD-dependent oxidoreductase [Blastocatellia bacterium]|nr:FAD-dependent oxidoreductase [Blastocatellia bacterium]